MFIISISVDNIFTKGIVEIWNISTTKSETQETQAVRQIVNKPAVYPNYLNHLDPKCMWLMFTTDSLGNCFVFWIIFTKLWFVWNELILDFLGFLTFSILKMWIGIEGKMCETEVTSFAEMLVLQVFWNVMFCDANDVLSHYICIIFHTFPEQISEHWIKPASKFLVWHIRVKSFYRGNPGNLDLFITPWIKRYCQKLWKKNKQFSPCLWE